MKKPPPPPPRCERFQVMTAPSNRGHDAHDAVGCNCDGVLPSIFRDQELCESRGGRPGLQSLTSLMVSVGEKQHRTVTHEHALVTVCP